MRKPSLVLLVCAVPFLFACKGSVANKEGKIVAVINNNAITEAMLLKEVEALPPYVRPIMDTPEGQRQFLDSLIARDLLIQEALRRGIDRRPEVRERLDLVRRSVLLEALLKDVTEKAPGLSEAALRKYYQENVGTFEVGERVRASHLLVRSKERADRLAARAKKGESFDALKGEMDASQGEAGADLGFIERERFIKEFEDAVFAAKAGSVVGPVRTSYGFHVIWVGERKPAGTIPFEEVREKIAADVKEQAQREAFDTLVAELRKAAKIRLVAKFPAADNTRTR